MGSTTSAQIAPFQFSLRSSSLPRQQDVVKLMMPVYYCIAPCNNSDIELARASWDMIISDTSPEFNAKRGQSGYEFNSCVMLFYSTFYARLFDVHPNCRAMFTNGLNGQGNFLVGMISICLTEITQTTVFKNRLIRLAEVHNDRGVKAIEYGIIGEVMFWTIRHCVGNDSFPSETQFAWIKIFSRMLSVMVPVAVNYELKNVNNINRINRSDQISEGEASASEYTKVAIAKNKSKRKSKTTANPPSVVVSVSDDDNGECGLSCLPLLLRPTTNYSSHMHSTELMT